MRIKVAFAAALLVVVAASAADARITKLTIVTREAPTFGGHTFPGVGQYEKLVGQAYGELDPNDPKNAVIVDIKLAPRNARGKVEYAFDFYILKPIDLSKGNHKMMYEPPNRGRKTHGSLNRGAGTNDPGSVTNPQELANLAFAKTKAERLASGDPRLSIEERYTSADAYTGAAKHAI